MSISTRFKVGTRHTFSSGFIHSESDVKYFGEEVPGVSQVLKIILLDLLNIFRILFFRVFQKIKPSVTRMTRAQSLSSGVQSSLIHQILILKKSKSLGYLDDVHVCPGNELNLFQANRRARPS